MKVNEQQLKSWQKLTQFILIDRNCLLGKGQYGSVYRGYSIKRQSLIAIKVVSQRQQFQRQIQVLKALSSLDHQNIMGYYGSHLDQNHIYIFMEFCPYGTLKDLLYEGITQLQVLRLFRQLLEGMCYMNAKKKMHRDLKPQNILLGPQMDIKISDFGLAQHTNSIFVTGRLGTPIYAAPQVFLIQNEQQNGYSDNCDVWSAGMILYQMLTKKVLLGVKTYGALKQQWLKYERGLSKVELGKQYHPLWNCLINWMVNFNPKRRPYFAQILSKLKLIYNQMQQQLTKNDYKLKPTLQKLQKYISFNDQKYHILIYICETFTEKDIRICNELKYFMMYCCLMMYLCFFKTFNRDLLYKRLKFKQKQIIPQNQINQPYLELIIIKHKNIFLHKYQFYNEQLRNNIIPKILNTYCKRQSSQSIIVDFKQLISKIIQTQQGNTSQSFQYYNDQFKNILSLIQKKHKDVTTYYNIQQLKIFNKILIAMLIQQTFPIQLFQKQNYIPSILTQIQNKNKDKLIQDINKLKLQIY